MPSPRIHLLTFFVVGLIAGATGEPRAYAQQMNGSTVNISLSSQDAPVPGPAIDLVDPSSGAVLSPDLAEEWKTRAVDPVDLSTLNPKPSDVWGKFPTSEADDQALPINTGDEVSYQGAIPISSPGTFRFNVHTGAPGQPVHALTLMINENLHSFLLRKELLRKLGYSVPGMKWIPSLRVTFPDKATRDMAIQSLIFRNTNGSPLNWVTSPKLDPKKYTPIGDPSVLEYTFQDLVAVDPIPTYYNLALGPPIEPLPGTTNEFLREGRRVVRAAALVYGLVNTPQSVNLFNWYVGNIDGGSYTFPLPLYGDFSSCTLDDARWIVNLISKLSRQDLTDVANGAGYPAAVAELLAAKIIARRDSLVRAFGIGTPALAEPADQNLNRPPDLSHSKLVSKRWPGYASSFALADPESPFADIQYYFLAEAEENAIDNLIAIADNAIPQIQPTAGNELQLIKAALDTGKPQALQLGLWAGPTVSGGVDFSRSVVIGNYLGTTNLLSLADNFGFHFLPGGTLPATGLPTPVGLSGSLGASLSIDVTHIKPLTSLKAAVTEPIQNAFVPWLFYRAADDLSRIASQQKNTLSPDDLSTKIKADLGDLEKYLGVGESLLRTESIGGTESLKATATLPVWLAPGASIQLGADQTMISRIQIYRRDEKTIQVFQDRGQMHDMNLAFEFTVGTPIAFPILTATSDSVRGVADSDVFTLSIDPDTIANPNLYSAAAAIGTAIRTGSTGKMRSVQPPVHVSVKFSDKIRLAQFFALVRRSLKSNSQVRVTLPTGHTDDYIDLLQGRQSGTNYQSVVTNAATFLLQQLTNSTTASVSSTAALDPGQTLYGHSWTRTAEYQTRLENGQPKDTYANLQYQWEGYQLSAADTVKLTDSLTRKYGFELYSSGYLDDTKDLKLYQLTLSIGLYAGAIDQIMSIDPKDESAIWREYHSRYHCCRYPFCIGDSRQCQHLRDYTNAVDDYRKNQSQYDPEKKASVVLQAVDNLEQFVDFQDLSKLAGGPSQFFINSTITGFREGSEELSTPIQSNTFGTVNPYNPMGPINTAQTLLGINAGEFDIQWLVQDYL